MNRFMVISTTIMMVTPPWPGPLPGMLGSLHTVVLWCWAGVLLSLGCE